MEMTREGPTIADWRTYPQPAALTSLRRQANRLDPASGERHLQGCYIDRDELLSRILVLQREG